MSLTINLYLLSSNDNVFRGYHHIHTKQFVKCQWNNS